MVSASGHRFESVCHQLCTDCVYRSDVGTRRRPCPLYGHISLPLLGRYLVGGHLDDKAARRTVCAAGRGGVADRRWAWQSGFPLDLRPADSILRFVSGERAVRLACGLLG